MFEVVVSPVFIFFYIDDKEKTNLIARSSHSNLKVFLKIHKYYNFKQNKARAYWNLIKCLFYLLEVAVDVSKKHLSCWRILLGKPKHGGVFWGILRQVSICRFHMTIFAGIAWKFSLVLWGYIIEQAFRSYPYNFPFASLVSKPKQICIKKS